MMFPAVSRERDGKRRHFFKVTALVSLLLVIATGEEQRLSIRDVLTVRTEKRIRDDDTPSNTLAKANETSTTITSNPDATIQPLDLNVEEIVAPSGIDIVLPLDCGKNPRNPGSPLDLDSSPFPWIAALGTSVEGLFYYHCTGVVIGEFHVLTDGNCAASNVINMVQLNVTSLPGKYAVENFVVGRRIHPALRDKEDFIGGPNIGILEMANPIKFDEFVQPICLPGLLHDKSILYNSPSFNSTLVGFNGISDSKSGRSGELFRLTNISSDYASKCSLEITSFNQKNPDKITTLHNVLTDDHICVYINFERFGNSLALREAEHGGIRRVQVIGVGGFANARHPIPIAFTSVQSQRSWIENILKTYMDNTATNRE